MLVLHTLGQDDDFRDFISVPLAVQVSQANSQIGANKPLSLGCNRDLAHTMTDMRNGYIYGGGTLHAGGATPAEQFSPPQQSQSPPVANTPPLAMETGGQAAPGQAAPRSANRRPGDLASTLSVRPLLSMSN